MAWSFALLDYSSHISSSLDIVLGARTSIWKKAGIGGNPQNIYLTYLWNEPCRSRLRWNRRGGAKEKGIGQGLHHFLTPSALSKKCGNSKERERQIMEAGEMRGAECHCRCDLSRSCPPGMELCPLTSCIHLIHYSAKIYGGKVTGKEDTSLLFL